MIKTSLEKGDKSTVEIKGTIAAEQFEKERVRAVQNVANSIHIDGFRAGKIPENVIVQKFGETPILEEMAQLALAKAYPSILKEHELEAIGRPDISITKLAKGNPLEFTIKTAVLPEVTLPDYRKIAKKVMGDVGESTEASAQEVEDVMTEVKNLRKNEDGTTPELTDDFIKTLGNFESLIDFKDKIKKNIELEKEIKARDKKRATVLEEILKETKTEVPDVLIETELDRIMSQLRSDTVRAGGSFEAYVESTGKNEEDLRREMREGAEKRVRFELILKNIGAKENMEVSQEDIEKEAEHVLNQYKGSDPERVGLYVEGILMNEKVLQFLEAQK
jgi:FKBP-type peptidyl-prolyl cis-trans isomerase (trigger factor)